MNNYQKYPNGLPTVETKRLLLRKRTVEDAVDCYAYASLSDVADNAGFPVVQSLQEQYEWLELLPKRRELDEIPDGWGITLKGQNKVIGSVDFNRKHAEDIYEVGYVLHPHYWGQGIVLEALLQLIESGFQELDLYKIIIRCHSLNKRSQRVAEKAGFTLEARLRGHDWYKKQRCDELWYGLLKEDWIVKNNQ